MRAGHRTHTGKLLRTTMRAFFHELYHRAAWAYDGIAWLVSLGLWFKWIDALLPYIHGTRVLELGYGTGHLLSRMSGRIGTAPIGLDESRQMAQLARRRGRQAGSRQLDLVRGLAVRLPLREACFDSVVATFPTEFIFDPRTLAEIHRVLVPGGQLVLMPAAWITGTRITERAAAWLFAVTRQVPLSPDQWLLEKLGQPMATLGFDVAIHRITLRSSSAAIVVGTK